MIPCKRELCVVHSDIDENIYKYRYEHREHILTVMPLNSTYGIAFFKRILLRLTKLKTTYYII